MVSLPQLPPQVLDWLPPAPGEGLPIPRWIEQERRGFPTRWYWRLPGFTIAEGPTQNQYWTEGQARAAIAAELGRSRLPWGTMLWRAQPL
jgi:hypothetical protein